MLFVLLAIAGAFAVLQLDLGWNQPDVQRLPRVNAPLSQHALEKHGDDANQAKQCLSGTEGFLFFNPETKRTAIVCWLEDRGGWGIVILCALTFTVITAFVSKKLRDRQAVRDYFERQGYQ